MLLFTSAYINAGGKTKNEGKILKELEKYVIKVKDDWKIPGMAVSVTKNGRLIYAKGFGIKDGGKTGGIVPSDTITRNTVFQIGSVSKSFTATLMAMLVDDGKVKWEDTVKNILPELRLYDKWVEQNIQVKDLMTHRTGIRGQMGTYIPNMGYDRDDVFRMMELMKPKYSFRGAYEYNNITFIIAQKVIEKLSGKSWEENINERIFKPLGMTSTSVNGDGFKNSPDVSVPHELYYRLKREASEIIKNDTTLLKNKGFIPEIDSTFSLPLYGEDQALHWLTVIGPAGSVNSTVTDLSKYARFHLDMGQVPAPGSDPAAKPLTIVSRKNMEYLHRGQTITSQDSTRTTLYGLCWFVEQNNRYRLYFHTGTTWGFTTLVAFVPELDLSISILVNSDPSSNARYAIMRRVIDLYLPYKNVKELRDYEKEYFGEWVQSERESRYKSTPTKRDTTSAPDPGTLAGTYDKGELFGKAVISVENGDLFITVGPQGWKHKLAHRGGLNFSFTSDGHTFPLKFIKSDSSDTIKSLDIDFGYQENFGEWIKIN